MKYSKSKIMQRKIVVAAEQLFSEKGFHDTTIREISENCGIPQSLIYYYFPSKNAIAWESIQVFTSAMEAAINRYLDFEHFPLLFLFSYVRLIAKELAHNPNDMLFYQSIYDNPNPDRPYAHKIKECVQHYLGNQTISDKKIQISVLIGDCVWSGLAKANREQVSEISIDELLDATDLARYTYLGIRADNVLAFAKMARNIVSVIPDQHISLFSFRDCN